MSTSPDSPSSKTDFSRPSPHQRKSPTPRCSKSSPKRPRRVVVPKRMLGSRCVPTKNVRELLPPRWSRNNPIDRLYSPALFLETIHERINQGGLLMLTSPYTWLPEHTKREEWIGGFKKDGENFTTFDGLQAMLGKHFRLVRGPESVPFVIRETKRKFQHTLSEVTIWERI